MDTTNVMETTGLGSWGMILFLILLFWLFTGNGAFGKDSGNGGCNKVSNCEVEKQTIINTAETNYLIEKRTWEEQAAIINAQRNTDAKIDYYAYQAKRDKVADLQRENMLLQNKLYSDAQFNAVNAKLEAIANDQIKAPNFLPYGGYVAATCGNFTNNCGCGC